MTDYRELRNCEKCLKFQPKAGEKIAHQLGLGQGPVGEGMKLTSGFLLSIVLM